MDKGFITINNIIDVMKHLDGLQAVIFDLDDTLYSEKEYVRSGYIEVGKKVLKDIPDAGEKLWTAFQDGKSAFDVVLEDAGIWSDDLIKECVRVYRWNEKPDIHLYDGVMEMLRELKAGGYKLGMITDGRPEGQKAKIKALGIESFIDHIIITDELGGVEYRKPNSKAFELMKEYFENIPYEAMVYVGDNMNKDFIAPGKLGMKSIYFRNSDGLY